MTFMKRSFGLLGSVHASECTCLVIGHDTYQYSRFYTAEKSCFPSSVAAVMVCLCCVRSQFVCLHHIYMLETESESVCVIECGGLHCIKISVVSVQCSNAPRSGSCH